MINVSSDWDGQIALCYRGHEAERLVRGVEVGRSLLFRLRRYLEFVTELHCSPLRVSWIGLMVYYGG